MKKTKNTTRKRLFSAIAMLTCSAVMLSTATYAWFSMNKEVSVSTMQISAKSADAIIEISANGTDYYNTLHTAAVGGDAANWTLPDTTIGSGASATPVKLKLVTPTAISSANAVSWGWAASSNHANAEVTNTTTAKALTAQTTPAKTESNRAAYLGIEDEDLYVLTQKLSIRNVSPDITGENLKIDSVTINGGTNTIAASVRLLFVSGGKYALYDGSGALITEGNHQWLAAANSTAMTVSGGKAIIDTAISPNKTEVIDVDVYMFFDGTDASAYTDNATDLSQVTAEFTFAID